MGYRAGVAGVGAGHTVAVHSPKNLDATITGGAIVSGASAIANAATRSLVNGTEVGNKIARTEIAMIKVQAPSMALKIIDDAIQAFGGAGVTSDPGLARAYAGQRTLRLADGPDEVHARTIARLELGKHAGKHAKEMAEEEARRHVPGIR